MRDYFKIRGLKQPEIAAYIEEVLRTTEGINQATINPLSSLLLVDYDKEILRREDILACVDQLGFPVAFEREDYSVPPSAVPALVQRMAALRRREERQGQAWERKEPETGFESGKLEGESYEIATLAMENTDPMDLSGSPDSLSAMAPHALTSSDSAASFGLSPHPADGLGPHSMDGLGRHPADGLGHAAALEPDLAFPPTEEVEIWEEALPDREPEAMVLKDYLQARTEVLKSGLTLSTNVSAEKGLLSSAPSLNASAPSLGSSAPGMSRSVSSLGPSSANSQPNLAEQVQKDQFSFDLASDFALASDFMKAPAPLHLSQVGREPKDSLLPTDASHLKKDAAGKKDATGKNDAAGEKDPAGKAAKGSVSLETQGSPETSKTLGSQETSKKSGVQGISKTSAAQKIPETPDAQGASETPDSQASKAKLASQGLKADLGGEGTQTKPGLQDEKASQERPSPSPGATSSSPSTGAAHYTGASTGPEAVASRLFTYGRDLYRTQQREKTILACVLTICLAIFTYSPLLNPRLFSFWLEPANIPLFAWIQGIFFLPILLTNQDLFRTSWNLAKHGHSSGETLIALAVAVTGIHACGVSFDLTRLSLSQEFSLLARYPLGANFLLPALALTAYRLGEWARIRGRRRHRKALEALAQTSPLQGRVDQAFQDLLLRSDRMAGRVSVFVLLLALLIGLLSLAINKNLELTVWLTYTILILGAPWAYQEYFWQSWQKCSQLAGQLGLYFRSPAGIETLGRSEALIFDDAGPLNRGTFTVQEIHPNPDFGFAKEDLLELAASLSSYESDDLDEAILAAAKAKEIQAFQPIYAEVIPNLGKHVIICGNSYYAGNLDLLDRFHLASELAEKEARAMAQAGNIPLLYFNEDNYLGSIALQDQYVAHAPALVHALEEAQVKSFYLYRHHPATVPAVSERLGLPADQVHADLDLPGKLAQVKAIRQKEGPSSLVLGEGSFLPLVAAHDQVVMALPEATLEQVAWEDPQLDHVNLLLAPDHLPRLVEAFALSRAKRKADRAFAIATTIYHLGSFAWASVLTFIFFDLPLHPYLAPFLALGMNALALVWANQPLLAPASLDSGVTAKEASGPVAKDAPGPAEKNVPAQTDAKELAQADAKESAQAAEKATSEKTDKDSSDEKKPSPSKKPSPNKKPLPSKDPSPNKKPLPSKDPLPSQESAGGKKTTDSSEEKPVKSSSKASEPAPSTDNKDLETHH